MLSIQEAEARAAALIERAVRGGADAADAFYYANASTSVQVRLGELEDVARNEAETVSLRLFVGRRSASVSSSDLSDDALARFRSNRMAGFILFLACLVVGTS